MVLLEKIFFHPGMAAQIEEWRALGMVGDGFDPEDILFTPRCQVNLIPQIC